MRSAFVTAAVVAVAAVVALLFWRVEDIDEPGQRTRPVGLEFPPPGSLAVRVKRGAQIALWDRPNGKVLRRIDDTTEFGSPEVLSPTGSRQGGWIAVRHTSLGNSGVAWVHARSATLAFRPRRVRVEIDLSRRELVVVPDAGHSPQLENPRRWLEAIERFLESVERATAA